MDEQRVSFGLSSSASCYQDAARSMHLPPESASTLMLTYYWWLEPLLQSGVPNLDDRQRICAMAADSVIVFAKAGLHPERVRQLARSNLRFMGSSREAAAVM